MLNSTSDASLSPKKEAETASWKLYLSGFMGGLILAIDDLATNDTAATVLKFQGVIQKHVMLIFAYGGTLGLIRIGMLGALFC